MVSVEEGLSLELSVQLLQKKIKNFFGKESKESGPLALIHRSILLVTSTTSWTGLAKISKYFPI